MCFVYGKGNAMNEKLKMLMMLRAATRICHFNKTLLLLIAGHVCFPLNGIVGGVANLCTVCPFVLLWLMNPFVSYKPNRVINVP